MYQFKNSFSEGLGIHDYLGFRHQGGFAYVDWMMDGFRGWCLHMDRKLKVLMYPVYISTNWKIAGISAPYTKTKCWRGKWKGCQSSVTVPLRQELILVLYQCSTTLYCSILVFLFMLFILCYLEKRFLSMQEVDNNILTWFDTNVAFHYCI